MLKKAIDYIHHLQMKNDQLLEHNKLLQKQINCKCHCSLAISGIYSSFS